MGLLQSKEAALYLQASCGNIDGIRDLHCNGAGLEWVDKEGRTPLILACTKPDGLQVAKALIDLGANVDAYRSGSRAGTPLHHAARKGLTQIVNLLLSHGANVYKMNNDCQTALDLAREKGHCNIVRAIENHISLFSGCLRELYGPGFLEVLAPKLVSRKMSAIYIKNKVAIKAMFLVNVKITLLTGYPSPLLHSWINENLHFTTSLWVSTSFCGIYLVETRISIDVPNKPMNSIIWLQCPGIKYLEKWVNRNVASPTELDAKSKEDFPIDKSRRETTGSMRYNADGLIDWAVVLPKDYQNPVGNRKLELAIYQTSQVAQPQTIIDLRKVTIEDVNFDMPDPVVIIVDKINTLIYLEKHFKFLCGNEGDKQQLLWFYRACKGMIQNNVPVQARRDSSTIISTAPSGSASRPIASTPVSEDAELAMAISASIQSAITEGAHHVSGMPLEPQNNNTNGWANSEHTTYNGWDPPVQPSASLDGTNGWADEVRSDSYSGWSLPESEPSISSQNHETQMPTALPVPSFESDMYSGWAAQESQPRTTSQNHDRQNIPTVTATPSAPPISEEEEDTFIRSAVHYPSVDFSPIDMPMPEKMEAFGTCVICLDAKAEGACIPCGHMAGCMSCVNEIKSKGWGCPVCRAKIDQVLKLYSV